MKGSGASVLLRSTASILSSSRITTTTTTTTSTRASLTLLLSSHLPAVAAAVSPPSSPPLAVRCGSTRRMSSLASSVVTEADTEVPKVEDQEADVHRHCRTCTCDNDEDDEGIARVNKVCHWEEANRRRHGSASTDSISYPCGHSSPPPPLLPLSSTPLQQEAQQEAQQQPPPAMGYSVRRRVIPQGLIPLNTLQGQQLLVEALHQQSAACYIPLTLHFSNQSDPAFCGITTLLVVLNAFSVDPQTRWKGGWRYFGDEESLTARCCLTTSHIQKVGITMEEFLRLAQCQGLVTVMKRAQSFDNSSAGSSSTSSAASSSYSSLEEFRRDIQSLCASVEVQDQEETTSTTTSTTTRMKGIVVVSYGRAGLQQTGDGHFSPIAAYHEATDQVLVLDVARFKYPPYWVKVQDLYHAMSLHDSVTQQPRGWYLLHYHNPKQTKKQQQQNKKQQVQQQQQQQVQQQQLTPLPSSSSSSSSSFLLDEQYVEEYEDRRPVHLVPPQQQGSLCPLHKVKVEYCQNNTNINNNSLNNNNSNKQNRNHYSTRSSRTTSTRR